MNKTGLEHLTRLVHVRYQARQQALSRHLAKENGIRAEIAKLDENVRAAESSTKLHMRSLGADILWKSWAGRTKSELNMQLAQLLAQKEQYRALLRAEFGRSLAANELLKRQERALKKERSEKQLSQAVSSALSTGKSPGRTLNSPDGRSRRSGRR